MMWELLALLACLFVRSTCVDDLMLRALPNSASGPTGPLIDPIPEIMIDPIPSMNPCAFTTCAPNKTCVYEEIACFRAPCPEPKARCIDIENVTDVVIDPQEDPCNLMECASGFTCVKEQVQCFATPCPAIAKCVQADPCMTMRCSSGLVCISEPESNCNSTSCKLVGKCANATDEYDPCAATSCPMGSICVAIAEVACKKEPCPRVGRCTSPRPHILPIPNPTSCTAKCKSGDHCEIKNGKPTCVASTKPDMTNPCKTKKCASNDHCVVKHSCHGASCSSWGLCVTCGKNETFDQCFEGCEATCEEPKMMCTRHCGRLAGGCRCKNGYKRSLDGSCVLDKDCSQKCPGKNEQFHECKPCGQRCGFDHMRIMCAAMCMPGCDCATGFLRAANGTCILASRCPGGNNNNETCPTNEKHHDCKPCYNRCNNKNAKIACMEMCSPGCDCKSGYLRHDNGTCVPEKACPPEVGHDDSSSNNNETCPANEEHHDCMPCNNRCSMRNQKDGFACMAICSPGCDCKSGYLRHDNGTCVPEKACPAVVGSDDPENCTQANVQFYKCRPCSTQCGHEDRVCKMACRQGCDCAVGYLRNDKGECIPKAECPSTGNGTASEEKCTKQNEKFYECKPCSAQCGHEDRVCKMMCMPGCDCAEGFLRNDEGDCVKKSKCPKTSSKQSNTTSDEEEDDG